jgi:hypothetical protein
MSVSQHHIPGTANGHRNNINLKTSYRVEFVNYTYILETIQENVLPTTGEKQVPKPFATALLTVVLNTQTWRCRMKPTVKMTYSKCTKPEISKSGNSLHCEKEVVE